MFIQQEQPLFPQDFFTNSKYEFVKRMILKVWLETSPCRSPEGQATFEVLKHEPHFVKSAQITPGLALILSTAIPLGPYNMVLTPAPSFRLTEKCCLLCSRLDPTSLHKPHISYRYSSSGMWTSHHGPKTRQCKPPVSSLLEPIFGSMHQGMTCVPTCCAFHSCILDGKYELLTMGPNMPW